MGVLDDERREHCSQTKSRIGETGRGEEKRGKRIPRHSFRRPLNVAPNSDIPNILPPFSLSPAPCNGTRPRQQPFFSLPLPLALISSPPALSFPCLGISGPRDVSPVSCRPTCHGSVPDTRTFDRSDVTSTCSSPFPSPPPRF